MNKIKIKEVMSIFKKMNELEQKLRSDDLKVIRSRKVLSDIGEWYAKNLFNLKLTGSKSEKGYDAKDRNGKRYQVKTTRKSEGVNAAIWIRKGHINKKVPGFDFLIAIRLDDAYKIKSLYKITVKQIKTVKYGKDGCHNMSWKRLDNLDPKTIIKKKKNREFKHFFSVEE